MPEREQASRMYIRYVQTHFERMSQICDCCFDCCVNRCLKRCFERKLKTLVNAFFGPHDGNISNTQQVLKIDIDFDIT